MDLKLKMADFASAIGVSQKTAYKMRDREEIITVNEKVNNRTIELVVISEEQLNNLKSIYRKDVVNISNCNKPLTSNEQQEPVNDNSISMLSSVQGINLLDKYINLNERYLEDMKQVNDELIKAKSRTLLLEDKAGREGYYINELNGLKKENNELVKYIKCLITGLIILVLIFSITIITLLLTRNIPDDAVQQPEQTAQQPENKPAPKPHK